MTTPELQEFFAVLRGGDPQAVEQMLGRLAPYLRRIIRLRLSDGRLRRVLDTADVCQSLLKDFLSRPDSAPPPAGGLGGLSAYLAAAVHHKIQTRMRKERRHAGSLAEDREPVSPEPAADRLAEDHDFREGIRARLPARERLLFDLKAQGLTWAEAAGRVGGTPDALRMRLTRAVAAALGELGDEGSRHAR